MYIYIVCIYTLCINICRCVIGHVLCVCVCLSMYVYIHIYIYIYSVVNCVCSYNIYIYICNPRVCVCACVCVFSDESISYLAPENDILSIKMGAIPIITSLPRVCGVSCISMARSSMLASFQIQRKPTIKVLNSAMVYIYIYIHNRPTDYMCIIYIYIYV